MPFLRVLRDKRGYETTYLVHWFREGSRQKSRILYVYRTPPGVRVGRAAFDPAVVREIESHYPEIQFDWRALVENRQIVETSPEPRRQRASKGADRGDRVEPRKGRREAGEPPSGEAPPAGAARPPVPETIEGETRTEQIVFLAKWYPELRERVAHRTRDPIRREALLALVERINAAAWDTEEQVTAGLQSAGEALHRLSRVLSKRRRRPRRPKPPDSATRPANGSA